MKRLISTASSSDELFLASVTHVQLFDLPLFKSEDGELVVMEAREHVPFDIARVFLVRAPGGTNRGDHAHKLCSQFLVCISGHISVVCDDGADTRTFALSDRSNQGLLVPPTIWAREYYRDMGSTLMVICDRVYEAGDYIRDRVEFLELRSRQTLLGLPA